MTKLVNGLEYTAINTGTLWYPYVSRNGKTVFSGKLGFKEREDALNCAKLIVEDEVKAGVTR